MSGASLEECHPTSGRILNEERGVAADCTGYSQTVNESGTMWSAAGLGLDVFDVLSAEITTAHCRTESTITAQNNNSHSKLQISFVAVTCLWCVAVSRLGTFFIWSFSIPCRNTSETTHTHRALTFDMFRRSRQAIIFPVLTALPPLRLHVSFAPTSSLLPIHITSHIDHPRYLSVSFLP